MERQDQERIQVAEETRRMTIERRKRDQEYQNRKYTKKKKIN